MDAKARKRRRESSISLRENRWSMSSQRLEQIVAELMKPISDVRSSFDRNLSGLLEEYLTEAGLRALAAEEAGAAPPPANFPELAMILHQSTENWGKKVDLLYAGVLRLDTELRTSAHPLEADGEAGGGEAGGGEARRRRRDASPAAALAFAGIALGAGGAARRDAPAAPPPTLPRMFVELEPRAPARGDRALRDYAGDLIGLLHDFSVSWRLLDGLLVEELETRGAWGAGGAAPLRPPSLVELQQACERAAPPPPRAPPSTPPPSLPSPPPSPPSPPPAASTPLAMGPPAALQRKRRSTVHVEELVAGSVKLYIGPETLARLAALRAEYGVPERWVRRVVAHRKRAILAARRHRADEPDEFYGFDSPWTDIGGFLGFGSGEGAAARAAALAAWRRGAALLPASPPLDSDDDGFFERSSSLEISDGVDGAELEAWRGAGEAAGEEAGARGEAAPLDLAALRRDVRRALPAPPAPPAPWPHVLRAAASTPQSVSRLFLSVLLQANRGEVEIVRGAPLVLGDFAVRALPAAPRAPRAPPAPPAPPDTRDC